MNLRKFNAITKKFVKQKSNLILHKFLVIIQISLVLVLNSINCTPILNLFVLYYTVIIMTNINICYNLYI